MRSLETQDTLEILLTHIDSELHKFNQLLDVSEDKSFYLGRIDALLDIQNKILKL